MSQVIEETGETEENSKGPGKLVKAAGVGMALMGSSLATAHNEPHIDHGFAPARWASAAISMLGWVLGAIAFPFGIWALVVIGGALQIVAIVVGLAMNAAGMGPLANDQWAAAKAEARAARA